MSPSATDRVGPIECRTSTTSPGRAKSKNHLARWVERLMQPWETLSLPCEATDHGAPWTNSPLLEMRTAYFTLVRYPPGASAASPNVLESMVMSRKDSRTTCAPLRVGFLELPALIGNVFTRLSPSYPFSVCFFASVFFNDTATTEKVMLRLFSPQMPSASSTP